MSEHAELATTPTSVNLQQILRDAEIEPVIESLEKELVGLAPVKARIRDIAVAVPAGLDLAEARRAGCNAPIAVAPAWSRASSR